MSTTLPRIAGIDEAGRGPWAGPVVAACVYLPDHFSREGLGDSKKLSLRQRELLYTRIVTHAQVSLGIAEAYEIDTLGIKKATHTAMLRAFTGLSLSVDHLQIDGNDHFSFPLPSESIIRGDESVPVISAASIVAKVFRDRLMHLYDSLYPQYQFGKHKGYGTKLHQEVLALHGPSVLHRKTYKPVQAFLPSE